MFKEIPIAHTISSSETDFPIYVKPSAIDGWGALTTAEAESIRIYADEAKTTELPREVVSSDEIHVKKGTLANGDSIYVDYDGVRSDYAVTATFGAQNAWNSNYLFVGHSGDASGGVADSTGNNNDHNTIEGNPTFGQTGKLGDAIDYDGAGDAIEGAFTRPVNLTVSAWINPDGTNGRYIYSADDSGSGTRSWQFDKKRTSNVLGFTGFVGGSIQEVTSTASFSAGSWGYGVATYDGNEIILYVNGSQDGSSTALTGDLNTSNAGAAIGAQAPVLQPEGEFDGQIDEVRLMNTAMSGNWISIEYANQNDPANFFGTATDVSTGKRRAGFNVFF